MSDSKHKKETKDKSKLYKWLRKLTIAAVVILVFLQTPTFQWFKSIAVMGVYSPYEASNSVIKDKGIDIKIPGGMSTAKRDWYPFVMTFNDDKGFSWFIGEQARMSVLYNFGHFSPFEYQSDYYDVGSPYYNSFYGAYAVSLESGRSFGFDQGVANIDEMVKIPTFDMKYLVLSSLGAQKPVISYDVTYEGTNTILGEEWYYFDADLEVSGAMHTYVKEHQAYIQYGRPPKTDQPIEDFELIPMYGRIYAKYIEDKDITMFFYCIAADKAVIEEWEEAYMAKTRMTID